MFARVTTAHSTRLNQVIARFADMEPCQLVTSGSELILGGAMGANLGERIVGM